MRAPLDDPEGITLLQSNPHQAQDLTAGHKVESILQNIEYDDNSSIVKETNAMNPLSWGESALYYIVNIIFAVATLGLSLLCGFYVVQPMDSVILTAFDKVVKVVMTPGLHWRLPLLVNQAHYRTAI